MQQRARVSIIAAIGRNHELGKAGDLIWRISDDLKHVKKLTMGHPLIMGRKTYESIGRPLPGRTNIVVSKSGICIDGVLIYDSLENALTAARALDQEEIFIFGGAQIYEQALPMTDRLYLTLIDAEDQDADTFFPPYDNFEVVEKSKRRSHGEIAFWWLTLERRK